MSEVEQETTAEMVAEADAEPHEPISDDEATEQDDDEDEDEQPVSEPENVSQELSEKQLAVRQQKVENENDRHTKRVAEIMGDDAPHLIQCPLCSWNVAGWLYPVEPPPEIISAVRAAIGLPDLSSYQSDPALHACPKCKGLGRVLTGSTVPGYEVQDCGGCAGTGYVGVQALPSNGAVEQAPDPVVTGPTVYGTEPGDPRVLALRDLGFTVIPPMQPVQG